MEQKRNTDVRILYVLSEEISLLDIPRVLDEMGYNVYNAAYGVKALEYSKEACKKIVSAIDGIQPHCVITYDFVQTVAQACMETGIPYIAWVYDAPQKELYTHYALYPCNYIFAFDRMQVKRLRDIGIQHIEYMPLAVHANKVKMVTDTIGKKMKQGYQHDISFIGRLYKMENETAVLDSLDENIRQELYRYIDACFMKWDKDTHMNGIMSEACVKYLGEKEEHRIRNIYPYMTEQFYYETALLSRMLAYRERVHVLNTLAKKYDVTLYTDDKCTELLSDRVRLCPGMGYDVVSHIYKKSKINLNISLHCIETGVPQRVQDIMASGAFVLSNYQEELEELFVPGEEIVFFHNEQEMLELTEYYLTHDKEREEIARRGQAKVLRDFDYCDALKKVFAYVDEAEKDRKESYIGIQRNELRERANQLLFQGTDSAYQKLYEIFTDRLYATTIQRTTDLGMIRVMAEIWHHEATMGISCIWDNVGSVEQAKRKYLEVKHGLWRIEWELSHEACADAADRLNRKDISKFFIAKTIYSDLQKKEETFVGLAKLMSEQKLMDAVELLTYGLLFLEGNTVLLIQKAEYLMKLKLWKEALNTLQIIENPTEEVQSVINDLEGVLNILNQL